MESREDKSLFQNHVFTFKISSFTTSIFLLIILLFFIKIHYFLNKIGPLWAHKGPSVNFKPNLRYLPDVFGTFVESQLVHYVNIYFLNILRWFGVPRFKTKQNHYGITSKSHFQSRNMTNLA